MTGNFPKSCFTPDGGSAPSCETFADQEKGRTCVDLGANCECTETEVEQKEAGTPQPYTTSGNTWTNGEGTSSGEYCVSGDILYFKEKKADGKEGLLYVLKRKP